MTSLLSLRSLSQRCEPMKPAPPVTSIRISPPRLPSVSFRRQALYQPSRARVPFFYRERGRIRFVCVRALLPVASAATATRAFGFLDATVHGRERGEQEEEQGVRGRVQGEVEEAVDEVSRTARERAERDAAPDLVVRLQATEGHRVERDDEGEAEQPADHARVRQDLQVVVVCLLKLVRPARRVVARID